MLVSQSYNIFNRYGKDKDALKDIIRAFVEDLREYSENQITNAFRQWRLRSDGMPAPANIIKIIQEKPKQSQGLMSFTEFRSRGLGDWRQYKKHLFEHNALSSNLDPDQDGVKTTSN